eukprot:4269951-Pleurochrysis_carterae.AAC.2
MAPCLVLYKIYMAPFLSRACFLQSTDEANLTCIPVDQLILYNPISGGGCAFRSSERHPRVGGRAQRTPCPSGTYHRRQRLSGRHGRLAAQTRMLLGGHGRPRAQPQKPPLIQKVPSGITWTFLEDCLGDDFLDALSSLNLQDGHGIDHFLPVFSRLLRCNGMLVNEKGSCK